MNKKLKARYTKLYHKLKKISSKKMGYPVSLMSSLYGSYSKDSFSINLNGQKLIDNSYLGITNNSLADMFIVNVGDPDRDSLTSKLEVKQFEREIFVMLTKHFGCNPNQLKGYVASGGTEGNLACLWWSKLWIINQFANQISKLKTKISVLEECIKNSSIENLDIICKQNEFYKSRQDLNDILSPVVFYTENHTHYSLLKIFSLLNLKAVPIKADLTGSMDINDLCNKLYYHANNMPERGVIINVNIYTTITGAIDNVIEIKKTAESILKKIPYTIHADGSIGGILMPIMKPFQQKVVNYFCDLGINTMSISTQKFLGSVISGIAMVKSDFLKSAFNNDTIEIDYIGNIIDNTIACARSGLNILLIHNALHALNVGIDNSFIRKIYYNNLRNASYLYTELSKLSSPSEVLLLPHSFNVVFNRPSKELMVKYQLMPAFTNKAVICVLQNVTLGLIEEFLKDYKRALSIK